VVEQMIELTRARSIEQASNSVGVNLRMGPVQVFAVSNFDHAIVPALVNATALLVAA
jgi:hypothetical protein